MDQLACSKNQSQPDPDDGSNRKEPSIREAYDGAWLSAGAAASSGKQISAPFASQRRGNRLGAGAAAASRPAAAASALGEQRTAATERSRGWLCRRGAGQLQMETGHGEQETVRDAVRLERVRSVDFGVRAHPKSQGIFFIEG